MDNTFQAFIALFYAIDRLYDECPCDTTGLCAGELNPFLWKSIGSADPAYYAEFSEEYAAQFPGGVADAAEAYAFSQKYAGGLSSKFHILFPADETITSLFNRFIDEETWNALWERGGESAAKRIEELG